MSDILEVKKVSKSFGDNKVLNKVSFGIEKGKTLGLIGESGSGKTTICKIITNILDTDSGSVSILGIDNKEYGNKVLSEKIQMVFQSPYQAMNPAFTIKQNLMENLIVHDFNISRKEGELKVKNILSIVSLNVNCLNKYPHQLSGGELQRVGIARALLLKPDIIILDEVTSALDATIQKDILDLLKKIQKRFKISYLIVSHNLNVVRYMSDYIAILNNGKIIEYNTTKELFKNPQKKYTKWFLTKSMT